jgi:protein-S-isoprenylcysteine O-methyltransferase Ste14
MRASAIEFRLRYVIIAVLITMGFWSPWIEAWGLGQRRSVLAWLALELTRMGVAQFRTAAALAIVTGTLVAALAVVLRVWGTAYLGAFTVNHLTMQAGAVRTDGPYRFVRNPLYLGTWTMTAAMAFAMPPTGALVALVLLAVFLLRLILGEEAFLREKLGEPYAVYLASVPRIVPRLRSVLPHGDARPRWGHALLAEVNVIGVLVALGGFSWGYNNWRIIQVILIGLGVSLVVRALMPMEGDQSLG